MEDLKQHIENSNLLYAAMRNFPNPKLISDEALNDSNKTITIPANKTWEILSIWIEYISTATVGNRSLGIEFLDSSSDIFFSVSTGILQAASLTRKFTFAFNLPRETAFFSTNRLYHPLPLIFLPSDFNIVFKDTSSIDAAADDMIIHIMVNEWDVS